MRFTTKGRITLLRDGVQISTHVLAEEAYERAYAHALANGPGKYTVRYPDREVDLSTLTRVVLEAAPAGLTTQAISSSQVNLTWTANPRAASYRVYRNSVLVGSPTTASYSDTGLTPSTAYTYTVSTVSATTGEGPQSAAVQGTTLAAPDTTAPTAPVITATPTGQNTISVALTTPATDSQSGVASYDLEYKTAAASTYTAITGLTAAQFPNVIGSLTAATTYNTRARARDGVGNIGPYSAVSNATTQAAAGGPITVALTVEYVDAVGVFRSVAVNTNGSTVISGIAPFLVHFNAMGSRGNLANNNTQGGAFVNLGFRLNYGEGRGTTWTYGQNNSQDEDLGAPIFGHVYEVVGTHTTRLRVRDTSGNESTVSLSVAVSAPPAPTIIEPTAGGWPTWVSGTHYALRANGNYSGFGAMNVRGVHNVLISKTGAGADPIVSELRLGEYGAFELSSPIARTQHVRTLDIDLGRYYDGLYGARHCGAVNGRVRTYDSTNHRATYNGATSAQRAQIMYPRGVFWRNTGLLQSIAGNDYVMIHRLRGFHPQGVRFNRTAGSSVNHIMRNLLHQSSFRNCQLFASVPTHHFMKMASDAETDWAADSELAGPPDFSLGSDGFKLRHSQIAIDSLQIGQAGDNPSAIAFIEIAPQNNDAVAPDEGFELIAFENVRMHWPANDPTFGGDRQEIIMGGRDIVVRNVRHDNGTGAGIRFQTNWSPNRVPPGWNGPYTVEVASNSRPVPSAF